jgi:hypothetical protein
MAKGKKTKVDGDKSPREGSDLFHNIMKASMSGNPKPKKKAAKKRNK